jgi:carbon-monoxide dehydrogenase medium subunit
VAGERLADLRLVLFAIGDRPVRSSAASRLINVAITPEILLDASAALEHELDPPEDQQATPSMRRHLAKVLLGRCVAALLGRPDLAAGVRA